MSSSLGFVVLARRPGQPDEIISAVFPEYPNGLGQAENVLESATSKCRSRYDSAHEDDDTYCVCTLKAGHDGRHRCACDERWIAEPDPVVYVIGEISERTP